jgi:hypothetical protein
MTICIIHKLKCPPLLPWKYHYHFIPLRTQERANHLLSGTLISLRQDFNPEHWTIKRGHLVWRKLDREEKKVVGSRMQVKLCTGSF